MPRCGWFAALAGLTACEPASSPKAVSSDFERGDEGWTVAGDAQEGGELPTWEAEGGQPGGWISAEDDTVGGVWYWAAPEEYLGEKGRFFGGTLAYGLVTDALDSRFEDADVVLEGAGRTLERVVGGPAGEAVWTRLTVELSPDGWTEDGAAVEASALDEVLGDLTGLWIRGEFNDGPDSGGLDTVALNPPSAERDPADPVDY